MNKRKKSLAGWTWQRWDFWFTYGDNGFLNMPEIMKNRKVKCLEAKSRSNKVRITIEEI